MLNWLVSTVIDWISNKLGAVLADGVMKLGVLLWRSRVAVMLLLGVLLIGVGIYSLTRKQEPQIVYVTVTPTPTSASTPQRSFNRLILQKAVRIPSTVERVAVGDVTGRRVVIKYKSGHWNFCIPEHLISYGEGVRRQWPGLLVPDAPIAGLVGWVGNDDGFEVGQSYDGRPGSGQLYLGINEQRGKYGDNEGTLVVQVEMYE